MELITSHRNYQWLCNLITGDEKWVLYIKYTHKRQWLSAGQIGAATSKTDPHSKKVMLSVWWGIWRNHSLGTSSKRLHHQCWFVLPTIRSACITTQGKARSNLLLAWQRETSCCKVDTPKIIGARMGHYSASVLLSGLGSYRLPFISFSV